MDTYLKLDQQIHQLSQTLAKFGRTYAENRADDSHTNVSFDPISNRIIGRWVSAPKGPVIMALNLNKFSFELCSHNWKPLHTSPIQGKTQQEIELHIGQCVSDIGLDKSGFIDPLHFDIPDYAFAKQAFSNWTASELSIWTAHRSLANDTCERLLKHLAVQGETRLWPHHFDTGIYVQVSEQLGLGFGLAMEDDVINAPYYYYSGYGSKGLQLQFDKTAELSQGTWQVSEKLKGAVLPLSEANTDSLDSFMRDASQWYLNQ